MMIKKNKFNFTLLTIVLIQIFLLVNMSFADSYFIHQTDPLKDNKERINEGKNKDLTRIIFNLIVWFLSIEQIRSVYALSNFGCCLETTEGAICQPLLDEDTRCADGKFQPASCDDVSSCKLGCCIESEEGLCTTNSPKQKCEDNGGTWSEDESCNFPSCNKGCCVVGQQTNFLTEESCQALSNFYGVEKDWRQNVKTEFDCVLFSNFLDIGACVSSDMACRIKTRNDCSLESGDFYKDYLCSAPELAEFGINCTKQDSISCIEGKNEIYWFDSCGNKENIYSSDKEFSWNNGRVLKKENSCNPDSGNINSEDCGNCEYFLGSICSQSSKAGNKKVRDGNYVCKDVNCYDTYDRTDKKNGDSWCVYDASIGNGTDPVGSNHWIHQCIDGEEISNSCDIMRNKICVENTTTLDNGEKISFAGCVTNEWFDCLKINNEFDDYVDMKRECDKNNHCYMKMIWDPKEGTDSDLSGGIDAPPVWQCLPEYSPGLPFYDSDISSAQCSIATQSNLKAIKVKKCSWIIFGSYKWAINPVTREQKFTQSMNKWCTSIGDCGAYVNYIGVPTDGGYKVIGETPKLTRAYLEDLKQFKTPDPSQSGKQSGKSDYYLNLEGLPPETDAGWGTIAGTAAGALYLASSLGGLSVTTIGSYFAITSTTADGTITYLFSHTSFGAIAPYASAAVAVAFGYFIGIMIGNLFGLGPEASQSLAIVGAATALGVGIYSGYFATGAPNVFAFGPALVWAIIVVFVLAVISWLMGCGKKRIYDTGFECWPWEPPSGGNFCNMCNNDVHECSEYRCKSLGDACGFIDQDTSHPKCVWLNPSDIVPPMMTPWQESLTDGYSYTNTLVSPPSLGTEIISNTPTHCLEAFKTITFGIQTDKLARCRYSFEDKDYTEMNPFTGASNTNHTSFLMSPGVKTLQEEISRLIAEYEGITPEDEDYSAYLELLNTPIDDKLRVYVKCKSVNGYINTLPLAIQMCIDPEPDKTPPAILSITPKDNSIIKFDAIETAVMMYVNEPSECKYSSEDKPYDLMESDFACDTELTAGSLIGWKCSATLSTPSEDNTFYIKCRDRPFAPIEERNTNNGISYHLKKSVSILNIDSITFTYFDEKSSKTINSGETLEVGSEPFSSELKATTSGGGYDGKSQCSFSFKDSGGFVDFMETFSTKHTQKFSFMKSGTKELTIKCIDDAGNTAQQDVIFQINIDSLPPSVSRVYNDMGSLKIITTEDAECYYSLDNCYFNIENATSMTSLFSASHTAEWVPGKTYYVKCRDAWGNMVDGCSIVVSPNMFV
ncbi:MAG: hypothetical protein AABW81_03395 [Nanoarchaeota archaeon]